MSDSQYSLSTRNPFHSSSMVSTLSLSLYIFLYLYIYISFFVLLVVICGCIYFFADEAKVTIGNQEKHGQKKAFNYSQT